MEHLGTPRAPGWPSRCRDITHDRKPEIEWWVAALLMDLIDDDTGEKSDWTAYPGRYVAEVFKTCEWKGTFLWIFPDWKKRSRVSDIVWCLENYIHPHLHKTVFPRVDLPARVKEGATEPPDWDPLDIRAT